MSIYPELSYNDQKVEIQDVKGIQFSVLGPQEIRNRSVVEITKTDTYAGSEPIVGGLFDSRMGVLEHNRICCTCEQKNIFCPGHFGHIFLAKPVFHAMFFDIVRKILNCVCYKCSKCLISPNTTHKDFKNDINKILSMFSVPLKFIPVKLLCGIIHGKFFILWFGHGSLCLTLRAT